jgi:hypothetical protein
MVAMHSSMVQDRKKVIDTYKIAYGLSDVEAQNKATLYLKRIHSFLMEITPFLRMMHSPT